MKKPATSRVEGSRCREPGSVEQSSPQRTQGDGSIYELGDTILQA